MKTPLDAAAYWKLRAYLAETQSRLVAAGAARDALQNAQQKQDALLRELGLDPKSPSWALDDDTLTVTTPDTGGQT
jgi:hypothetical protein